MLALHRPDSFLSLLLQDCGLRSDCVPLAWTYRSFRPSSPFASCSSSTVAASALSALLERVPGSVRLPILFLASPPSFRASSYPSPLLNPEHAQHHASPMLPTPLLHAALPLNNPITTLSVHPDYQRKTSSATARWRNSALSPRWLASNLACVAAHREIAPPPPPSNFLYCLLRAAREKLRCAASVCFGRVFARLTRPSRLVSAPCPDGASIATMARGKSHFVFKA